MNWIEKGGKKGLISRGCVSVDYRSRGQFNPMFDMKFLVFITCGWVKSV